MSKAGMDYVMPFGKYRGVSINDIILKDSKYVMWMIDRNILSQGVTDEVFESAYVTDNDLENPDSDFYKNNNEVRY